MASNETSSYRLITHSGNFHADDVFAIAALTLYLDDASHEIIRTRDPEVIATGDLVVDVGNEYDPERKRFDHHQHGGAGERDNGIPYSSLGLVWKHYGKELCHGSEEAARIVDERLCQPIDAGDNGVSVFTEAYEGVFPYLIQNAVAVFRPSWQEERDHDAAFHEISDIARRILIREIKSACDEAEGAQYVEAAYQRAEDKRIIILEGDYPWEGVLNEHSEPLYVVKPDPQNGTHWKVKAVRENIHTFEVRKPLPEEWAGKRNEALVEASGVKDAVFCHNKRFIAVAASREGACALAEKAVAA